MTEEIKDMTAERDVSDAVMEHDAGCACGHDHCECEHAHEEDIDRMIPFKSMNGTTYLIDPDAVNWAETSRPENIQAIEANADNIREMLATILRYEPTEPESFDQFDEAFRTIHQFLTDSGFDPLVGYQTRFMFLDDRETAILMCIDALEFIHIILRQTSAFNSSKNVLDSIMNSINNTIEEENKK